MLRLMEVFGRVLALRGITPANVAARLALAKLDPDRPLRQTLRACPGVFCGGKSFALSPSRCSHEFAI